MYETCLDVIENLLNMIETYGFVLNGARVYYEKRSQPPVMTLMVYKAYEVISKFNISMANKMLNRSYDLLLKEYEYWTSIKLCDNQHFDNQLTNLSCYKGFSEMPRPESYKEDLFLSEKVQKPHDIFFKEIIAGAETGWDFTSRFFYDSYNMSTINVSHIIPVDLNAILYKVEKTLSEISMVLQNRENHKKFNELSIFRKKTIMELMYDRSSFQWKDVNLDNSNKNQNFYLSNYVPLWAFSSEWEQIDIYHIIKNLDRIQEDFIGGLPTSLIKSGQQWDFPNVWPPLQEFIIFGLKNIDLQEAQQLALVLAQKYINNAYCGWTFQEMQKGKGIMFEKYDATSIGNSGHGGEYEVQDGFGWSNGVALKILKEFGKLLESPKCDAFLIEKYILFHRD